MFNAVHKSEFSVRDYEFGYRGFNDGSSDVLFKGSESEPRSFVRCSSVGNVPFPSCTRYLLVAQDLNVQYSVSRSYLESLDEIDEQIIALLNQFEQRGPALAKVD